MAFEENGFPIEKGRVNKTSGTVKGVALCVADGSLTVAWGDATATVVACVAGNAYNLKNAESATVTTGTFHDAG